MNKAINRDINPKTEKGINLSLKYSNNPEVLKKVIDELSISIHLVSTRDRKEKDTKGLMSLDSIVFITRNSETISFEFHFSHNDAMKVLGLVETHWTEKRAGKTYHMTSTRPVDGTFERERMFREFVSNCLYSVLCSVGSEYTTANTFEEFCSDFGYDEDSREAERIFHACQEQTAKLKKIFSVKEIESMPS